MSFRSLIDCSRFITYLFTPFILFQDLDERHYACYECKALLQKTYNFIQKTLRAQKAMYDILQEHDSVSCMILANLLHDFVSK